MPPELILENGAGMAVACSPLFVSRFANTQPFFWKKNAMVLNRRNRLISFRLSEEEYKSLWNLCVATGARSVSDYARSTLCQVATGNGRPVSQEHDAEKEVAAQGLIDSMERLSKVIARLSQLIEKSSLETTRKSPSQRLEVELARK